MTDLAPIWLKEQFPKHSWTTLRSCNLRVDVELGAGLDMEETDLGFVVDAIAEHPGQAPIMRPGDAIVAIAGVRLQGLPAADLTETFGKHFGDGVELLLITADELRVATIERDANEECPCEVESEEDDTRPEDSANYELLRRTKSSTEYDATVRIPVGRSTQWRLEPETLAMLEADLAHLSERFGLLAQPHFSRDGGMDAVVLSGLSTAIASARSEVTQVIAFYRDGRCDNAESGYEASTAAGTWRNGRSVEEETCPLEVPAYVLDLRQFEFLDHTADIIVHSWGKTRSEAFAQVCVGMFQYMTELDKIDLVQSVEVEASGHDLLDLLYHLLDEFLYVFATQMHISRRIEILDFDETNYRIRARGYGDRMDLSKHEQGTEIKAITMHMMRIIDADTVISEEGTKPRVESGEAPRADHPHETYVLLDI